MATVAEPQARIAIGSNPMWYKDAIVYQLHVRAFYDSNGDGIGDFPGLTQKLGYLQDLGVTAIWLLPFYPSPLKDDGYDIADYRNVHPNYGTIRDFRVFLREAHRRGLKVITELVINHTSDQHPWFRRARRAPPGSRWRDYYVWSDTPDRYREARIIFKDFETANWSWDPVAKAYFWHRFYSHQPDLNFDNPEVRRATFQNLDYWLSMGVDGLRLDAVPYLFEREGTNCENLPETHAFLKELRAHVDARYHGRLLLAEANQWPEDAAAYFGNGDECHAAFHFPVMPRLYMSVHMEDRFPIVDILNQTPAIPENAQWFLFLRNHDELTLEMVTEEERNYMYRVYAREPQARINLGIRRRLAPLMQNNRRRIELMNALLLSLPGTPIIYYGDEIGMGDNIYLGDRNGVRTPMQWSGDRNAGFSDANPQRLFLPPIIDYEYHYETVNVETQQKNLSSLLSFIKRAIALRRRSRALTHGTLEFLYPDNNKVLAFLRRYHNEVVMVVANLSRFAQYVELDLKQFQGQTPVELFGHTHFPKIGELTYLLTLAPHSFFLFQICPAGQNAHGGQDCTAPREEVETELTELEINGDWERVFHGHAQQELERLLPAYLKGRRWFGGKAKQIRSATLGDIISLRHIAENPDTVIALVDVEYADADPETYLLPLGFGSAEHLQWADLGMGAVLARLNVEEDGRRESGVLFDPFGEDDFCQAILDLIASRRVLQGFRGKIVGKPLRSFRRLRGRDSDALRVKSLGADQSNSAVLLGERFLLKIYRRLEPGVNPEVEIGAFLTDKAAFPSVPPLAGTIEYRADNQQIANVGMLQGYVRNEGNAWKYTLAMLRTYFEKVLSDWSLRQPPEDAMPHGSPIDVGRREVPPAAQRLFGAYLQSAELLGRRTAEMHLALAMEPEHPAFAPEPFSRLYQRSLYQGIRNQVTRALELLRRRMDMINVETRPAAESLLGRREDLLRRLRGIAEHGVNAMRIRCHGDYHLGQVLYTGTDFVIIDFEGEPARPISERSIKTTPFRDVAGMLRSFDYACHVALESQISGLVIQEADYADLEKWVQFWVGWTCAAFVKSYLSVAGGSPIVPQPEAGARTLLDLYLAEKAVYELTYELNNRPDWTHIPLKGILRLLDEKQSVMA
jgi:maltose alpha-D-glucosyltransferase/alpha-amylase